MFSDLCSCFLINTRMEDRMVLVETNSQISVYSNIYFVLEIFYETTKSKPHILYCKTKNEYSHFTIILLL